MFTSNQIISEIRTEKDKKISPLLNLNTVMNISSSILGCKDNKKELIRRIHEQSSDEDVISIYFAMPVVVHSFPQDFERAKGVWDTVNIQIESIIPEIKVFQSQTTQKKMRKVLSMEVNQLPLINNVDDGEDSEGLLFLEVDAALAFTTIQLKFIHKEKKNSEYFWMIRNILAPNRRLVKAIEKAEELEKK